MSQIRHALHSMCSRLTNISRSIKTSTFRHALTLGLLLVSMGAGAQVADGNYYLRLDSDGSEYFMTYGQSNQYAPNAIYPSSDPSMKQEWIIKKETAGYTIKLEGQGYLQVNNQQQVSFTNTLSNQGNSRTYFNLSSTGTENQYYIVYDGGRYGLMVNGLNSSYNPLLATSYYNNQNAAKWTFVPVTVDPESMSVDPTDVVLDLNDEATLTVELAPEGCYDNVTFASANPSVATVDGDGVIKGVAYGSTTIAVVAKGSDGSDKVSETVNVTVRKIETGLFVIYYNGGGDHFMGGENTTDITTFNPAICLWTGGDGAKWQNGNGNYLYYDEAYTTSGFWQNNRTYTQTLKIGNTATQTFSFNGSKLYREANESATRPTITWNYTKANWYVRFNGTTWEASRTDNQNNVVYPVTKQSYDEILLEPTITGDDVFSQIGNKVYKTSPKYRKGYVNYRFDEKDHIFLRSGNSDEVGTTATNSEPTEESFDYAWSLSANAVGHVRINQTTGEVSYDNYFDEDTEVIISVVAKSDSKAFAKVSKTVSFKYQPVDPTGISVSPVSKTIFVGEDFTVDATLEPSNAYRRILFSSANPEIASVTADGRVIANAVGSTIITVQAELLDGTQPSALKKTINVTVKPAPVNAATPQISLDSATGQLSMNTVTSGAEIFYTINGVDPTLSSAKYDAANKPVLRTGATVKAIAGGDGYVTSSVSTLVVSQVATPVIKLNGTASATVTCSTDGSTLYYTTDGTQPTTESATTTGTINGLAVGDKLWVMAVKDGMLASLVAKEDVMAKLANPVLTFSNSDNSVSMSAEADAVIYYTTDGSLPNINSTVYNETSKPVVTSPATIRAFAVKRGNNNSGIENLTINQVETPVITATETSVNLSCETDGVTYYYTVDGIDPTLSSSNSTGTISVSAIPSGSTLKVIAVKGGMINSMVEEQLVKKTLSTPSITVGNTGNVTITGPANATIYYTTDGTEPTSASTKYSAGFNVAEGKVVKAIAIADGYYSSSVATAFRQGAGTAASPTLIASESDLRNVRSTGNYKVVGDFSVSNHTSISNFQGTFDGGYYTISGLNAALFDNINGGTVKNVRLEGVGISGGQDVGAIANTATNAKIYNCGVLGGSVSGSRYVGGLVGAVYGTTQVVNNYNYATVSGGASAAGVVGYNGMSTASYLHLDDGTSMTDWPRPAANTEGNFQANNNNRPDNYSGNLNGGTFEAWRGNNRNLQNQNIRHNTLNNLPAGMYTVSVDLVINRATPSGIQFYLNGNTAITNQEVIHNNGYYEAHIERQVEIAANGSITFGFTLNNANFNWMLWDNAKVELSNADNLTRDMYHQWSSYQANATITGNGNSDGSWGTAAVTVYGDGNVSGNMYADLSDYSVLALTVASGTPRLLFNRQGNDNSGNYLEINAQNSEYVLKVENGVWYYDLNKIKTWNNLGYAHLNVIKGANWQNVNITRAVLTSGIPMIANCVNYATEISGTNKYPVYGGNDLDNKKNPLYDFFLYDGATYRESIISTNGALPAEARFLNRFEYVRATLNAEKKLAAYYLFGTQNKTGQDEIGKWVLDKEIAPYPIIKPWFGSDGKAIKYPSLVNPDVSNRTVGTLSVNISGYGSVSLPISDQYEEEFDYGYHKVQLPYYNDYFNDNYKANSVVTGWKITGVTGGTAGSFTKNGNDAYNFADRNNTQKDIFSVSGRVFAQGGYYYVPEGVTGITIEPYWANDVVYLYDPNIDKVFGMGYSETNFGPTYQPTFTPPTGAKVRNTLRDAHDALTASVNVYDHAIVLIGNVNFRWNGQPLNNQDTKGYTIMSIDEDRDNEPDYVEIYGHVDRRPVPPTRLDFVHQVGISWVKKPMGETLQSYSGIPLTRGHFEITETAFARFTEFETGTHVNKGPLIFNAGLIDQFVTNRDSDNPNIDYAILGGHTYFNAYTPGCHPNSTRKTTFWPVSVMGGEYAEFYLTGMKSEVDVAAQNGRVYTNGGKMGTFAGAYWEQLNGNAIIRFDHTQVKEFYGGGINPAKPITGNIDIIINNCDVDFFCAGPKAGNMAQGKTVTTVANNTKFGTYVGAGYGGSSVARFQRQENVNGNDYMYYKNTFFNNYFNADYLKFVNDRGILIRYAIEYMPGSGGMGGSLNPTHVTRFYDDYAQLSLARTYNVTSTLKGCEITGNFYGGPWSGTVGTNTVEAKVTSTLTDCTVGGSVFGGGKSAEIPTITVYPKEANALKDPLYSGQFGMYYQQGEDVFPVYPEGTEYTWVSGAAQGDASAKRLGTDVDLTNLGTIFGNTQLTIDGGTIMGNVFGAGDASKVTGTTNVTITGGASVAQDVYGGANQANVGGNTVVDVLSGTVGNVFGANNVSGTKDGTVTVNINQAADQTVLVNNNVYGGGNQADYTGNPLVNMQAGTVNGSVFGGGLSALVTGNTDVEVTGGQVNDAVYGGGALANVTGNTVVNLFGGTVHDVYGGALGRQADPDMDVEGIAAEVGGNTTVNLGNPSDLNQVSVVTGSIFGANNLNGTPKGHVKVHVLGTVSKGIDGEEYHVAAVYGGGNMSAYEPTDLNDFAEVIVENCDNSIDYVYGGGNAAPVPATKVTIWGANDINNVFGGGNGAGVGNPGANVGVKADNSTGYGPGTTEVNVFGGTIHNVFGGSNTKGLIRVRADVNLEEKAQDGKDQCLLIIDQVYGAGNEAEMYGAASLNLGCITGLDVIYGGAKDADFHGDVVLNLTSGTFGKVFGGNNQGGILDGSITVNIDETGCHPLIIGELYACGNLAAYTTPAGKPEPTINVISCTSIGSIFGAGLGDLTGAEEKATVTGNPIININQIKGVHAGTTPNGGTPIPDALGPIGNVFGGGNAAKVVGSTTVNIGTEAQNAHIQNAEGTVDTTPTDAGANIIGNVYGGGNAADVTGKTNVKVGRD